MTNKNIKILKIKKINVKKLVIFSVKFFFGCFFDKNRNLILTSMIINNLVCFCQNR